MSAVSQFLRSSSRLAHALPTTRLEAFSDGVFAIAITLLVIEIHAPHVSDAAPGALNSALVAKWPQYFAFLLSFATIGIYWVNHHSLFEMVEKTNHLFALLTLALLLSISFLPFPTAVLGTYLAERQHVAEAVPFYLGALTWCSAIWWIGWAYARRARLLEPRLDPSYVQCMSGKYRLSFLVNLALVGLSFVSPALALVGATLVVVSYVIPPPAPKFLEQPA